MQSVDRFYAYLRVNSLSAVYCLVRVLVQCFDVEADLLEAVVIAYYRSSFIYR